MRVLDLGCGRGELTLHLARQGTWVTAVDFSAACLQLTAETLSLGPLAAVRRVRLLRADATALPLPDQHFQRIFCLDVLEHLYPWQVQQALAEIRRLLTPDGYAIIHTLPNRWALDIGYPVLRWLWPTLPAQPRTGYEQQVHVNELQPVQLARSIKAAGLSWRVWIEDLTTAQARWSRDRAFSDPVRRQTYPLLRRWWVRPLVVLLMRTPLRLIFGNDLFAVVWPAGQKEPPVNWPPARFERLAYQIGASHV